MRNAPLNYLITLAFGGLAWLLSAMIVGNYLSINVPLMNATVEEFLGLYRLLLAFSVVLAVGLACFWFFKGGRPDTAGKLPQARRQWDVLILITVVLGVVLTFVLVFLFSDETFALAHYAIFFGMFSLCSWLLFWVATLFLSPRTVMNCVRGRR